ncbi:hypothetical protein JXA12_05935 [Candidatus Woesearchaeota archaeon]|nr:hypothetical protein [Candidatus Woesearchaeota archaeon]
MNKKAVELAINTVIIITLGLLVLVVSVFLIKGFWENISIPEVEPPFMASRDNPLVMHHKDVQAGRTAEVDVDFLNTGKAVTAAPSIACLGGPDITLQAMPLTVAPGEGKRYEALLAAGESVEPKQYPCTVILAGHESQAIITVT